MHAPLRLTFCLAILAAGFTASCDSPATITKVELDTCPTCDVVDCPLTASCGNGAIDAGEQCDGTNYDGNDCTTLTNTPGGFAGGTLACTAGCTFDTSGCTTGPVCGNNSIEMGEDCEGTSAGNFTCADLGLGAGTLACDPTTCEFDSSDCGDCSAGTRACTVEIENLVALREISSPAPGDLVYVRGHTNPRDGGEGFFSYNDTGILGDDDDGIVINPTLNASVTGRWVRHFEGRINVNYYGVTSDFVGTANPVSDKIQKIIDYAYGNTRYDHNPFKGDETTKGNTVYFPNGQYVLDKTLIIKSGVSIVGEGENTLFSAAPGFLGDYMFEMDKGRIFIHMENFVLNGSLGSASVGGMHFKAQYSDDGAPGGLWRSTFKNITIVHMEKHGIYLQGGSNGANSSVYNLPNQHNIFENLTIMRRTDDSNCLRMEGQQSENIFIRSVFSGSRLIANTGANILINDEILVNGSVEYGKSNGNMFLSCGIGLAEIGMSIRGASNVTLESCWFENIFTAVSMKSSSSISVLNSRFANACGYGSLNPGYPTGPGNYGECIRCENCSVNVERNYVLVSNPNHQDVQNARFVRGVKENPSDAYADNTINLKGNAFQDNRLSRSSGVLQHAEVVSGSDSIEIGGKKQVFVVYHSDGLAANDNLRRIDSSIGSGEVLFLRATRTSGTGDLVIHAHSGGQGENIYLSGLASISLSAGEWATFIKVDVPLPAGTEVHGTYQLLSRSR